MFETPDRESEGFFAGLVNKYESVWKTFIQPDRTAYLKESLGPIMRRVENDVVFYREDANCMNIRGEKIEFSLFKLDNSSKKAIVGEDACIVYLHSHGGNRLEGLSLVSYAGTLGMNFCCFDFAGSGMSEGKYTTLGLRESEDCRSIIEVLQRKYGIRRFVLWGRSMGAVAAILYASGKQPHLDYLILDSPFSDIEQMIRDAGNTYISLGEYLAMFLFNMVKEDITKEIGQDLGAFKPINYCEACETPCVFLIGKDDPLVLPIRVKQMYDLYRGKPKELMQIKGTHSSCRDPNDIEEVIKKLDKFYNLGHELKFSKEIHSSNSAILNSTTRLDKFLEISAEFNNHQQKTRKKLFSDLIKSEDKENISPSKVFNLIIPNERTTLHKNKDLYRSPQFQTKTSSLIPFSVGPIKYTGLNDQQPKFNNLSNTYKPQGTFPQHEYSYAPKYISQFKASEEINASDIIIKTHENRNVVNYFQFEENKELNWRSKVNSPLDASKTHLRDSLQTTHCEKMYSNKNESHKVMLGIERKIPCNNHYGHIDYADLNHSPISSSHHQPASFHRLTSRDGGLQRCEKVSPNSRDVSSFEAIRHSDSLANITMSNNHIKMMNAEANTTDAMRKNLQIDNKLMKDVLLSKINVRETINFSNINKENNPYSPQPDRTLEKTRNQNAVARSQRVSFSNRTTTDTQINLQRKFQKQVTIFDDEDDQNLCVNHQTDLRVPVRVDMSYQHIPLSRVDSHRSCLFTLPQPSAFNLN